MKRLTTCVATITTLVLGGLATATQGSYAADDGTRAERDTAEADRSSMHGRLGLAPGERLVLKDVIRDADGTVHRRYDRTYKGLPVIGGDLLVHRAAGGRFTVDWASEANLGTVGAATPRVSALAASKSAARSTDLRSHPTDAELVVYAVGDEASLAWRAVATGTHARELVFVDARTGEQLAGWSDLHEADGTGNTLYSGQETIPTNQVSVNNFELRDTSRGNHRIFDALNGTNDPPTGTLMTDTDNIWGDSTPADRQSAATDVAYGHQVTWDFYNNVLGRNGIRGDGTTPRSFVHYGSNYENAYFDEACYCMVYGDGASDFRPLVSLDVVAHEMSHGTTAATANLIYFGESGGLNEATSDIFGSMAEFYANDAEDPGDYFIGEKVVRVAPLFLRRMDRPSLDAPLYNNLAHSYDCWRSTIGADDVHFSSGPANHFFYLLAEGSGAKTIGGVLHNSPTCNGTTINGIGRLAAGKIWYRALNVYMTSTTNYMLARDATIRAARDLYGAGSARCGRVVAAWKAVKVPAGRWTCGATPPALGANVVRNAGFEAGSSGVWTEVPANPSLDIITNFTSLSNPDAMFFPRTGSWYAFMNGYGGSATDSLHQTIAVPNRATAKLRFWVLILSRESSTSGANDTLKVLVDDGPGPPVRLATYSNRGANNSYTKKVVSLSAYAGSRVRLTFRGQETVAPPTAFLIDDVSVTPR